MSFPKPPRKYTPLDREDVIPPPATKTTDFCYTNFHPKCQINFKSLFEYSIPGNRTCKQAGIPLQWCACEDWKRLKKSSITVEHISYIKQIVSHINSRGYKKNKESCIIAKPYKLLSIHELDKVRVKEFRIIFSVTNSGVDVVPPTKYISWVFVNTITEKMTVKQIKRLTPFADEKCDKGTANEVYCICKPNTNDVNN